MRVAALIFVHALIAAEAGAQAPYFPEVYLAPQFEAPANAPSHVVVAGADEPGERTRRHWPRARCRSTRRRRLHLRVSNRCRRAVLEGTHRYHPLLLDLWFDDDPELLARRQTGRSEIPPNSPKNVVAVRPVTRDAGGVWRTTRDIQMVRQ